MAARNLAETSPRAADEYTPVSDGPVEDVIPFLACFCCISSCYYTFPGCVGYSGRQELLCCHSEYLGCKVPSNEEGVWCHWSQGHTYCATVDTLFKVMCSQVNVDDIHERCGLLFSQQRSQLFCVDLRCSVPLSDDIPLMLTCCFFTVRAPYAVYKTIQELRDTHGQGTAVNVPHTTFSATSAAALTTGPTADSPVDRDTTTPGTTAQGAAVDPSHAAVEVGVRIAAFPVHNASDTYTDTTTTAKPNNTVPPSAYPPAGCTATSSPARDDSTPSAAPVPTPPAADSAFAPATAPAPGSAPHSSASVDSMVFVKGETTNSSDAEYAYYP
jgi:hypothetical protein